MANTTGEFFAAPQVVRDPMIGDEAAESAEMDRLVARFRRGVRNLDTLHAPRAPHSGGGGVASAVDAILLAAAAVYAADAYRRARGRRRRREKPSNRIV